MKRGVQTNRKSADWLLPETWQGFAHRMRREVYYHEGSIYRPDDWFAGVGWMCGLVGRARYFGTPCGAEGIVPGAGNGCEADVAARCLRYGCVCGGLFLGSARRFPAREGREECDFRILGWSSRKSVL